MCGIAGILSFTHQRPEAALLEKMSEPLRRRGPDGGHIVCEGPLGFAHRRLGIIDVKARADQPLKDAATGCIIVFNGTIYNYRELRSVLKDKGHTFTTESDTEVLLKSYIEWGDKCLTHLVGMFAFAVWDPRIQKLFVARDRIGIKPLYFSHDQQNFLFASNTQSLLASQLVDTNINPIALQYMYTLHAVVPAPYTIFKGIHKLKPAHYLWVDLTGKIEEFQYWSLNAENQHKDWDDRDWKDAIEEKLRTAVRRRLLAADVDVGVLLSGGLDSSLIVALANEEGVKNLPTFSIGFEDQPEEKGSEFEFSDQVVERYQTDHYKYLIENGQALTRLPEAVAQMSEPLFGQDAIGFYLLSEKVSQHVRVVQSGQGADEVFGGYFWYPQMAHSEERDPLLRFSQFYFDRDYPELCNTFAPKFQMDDIVGEYVRDQLTKPFASSYLDQVFRFDTTTLIVDDPVKRVDNMTMAHGLEARVPFLDHELVELAASMPDHYKLMQGGKGILKEIARGKVPDSIIDRPKAYFPMPALKYVRGEFYDMMRDALTSSAAIERGIFNPEYVTRLLDHPEAKENFTRIQGSKLWHCALLEIWLQKVLP